MMSNGWQWMGFPFITCICCSLILIADQEIPVELTDEDQLMLHAFKRRWLSNEQDAKRADIRPVLRYVDRMWDKYDPAMK